MRNVVAIAGKEMRGYFASPIAYIVIGLFALVFGWFFYAILSFFNRQSMQMAGAMSGGMNVTQALIGPVFTNTTVVMLFLLPAITMRTYSEEKRSGTIELLLTSPLTDVEIILGKFLGSMGLYATMLAVTLLHMAIVFVFTDPNPDWKPIATTYIGLLLMGGCFISVGLLISSLTKNQVVAATATFVVFLMLWVINWIATFVGPTTQAILNQMSLTDHFDDFARGVIDTKHLIYYLSFIALGLYLTAKAVDTERWRG
jgi:ABC-2 type transport system permease protein